MLKKVALAVAVALAAQAASAASIDFHGYMRAGFGSTSEGGGLVSFGAPYSQSKFRLGNESDNYAEMVFGVKLYKGADGSQFNYITNIATSYDGDQDYEGDGDGFRLASRENYVAASGVFDGFLKGSQVWIGKRFYQRHDIHMTDYFYLGNTGMGAGIESIAMGPMKLSYAMFQNNGTNANTATRHDLRLAGIPLWKGTELEVGVLTLKGNPVADSAQDGTEELSLTLFGEMVTSNFMGGFNKLFLSYNTNQAAEWNGVDSYASGYGNPDGTLIKIVDHGVVKFSPAVEMSYVLDVNQWSDTRNDTTSVKLGVRPVFSFSEYQSVAIEAGMDTIVESDDAGADGAQVLKLTAAYQIQAGKGYWARPALRFYGTYADWNDEGAAWGQGGGRFGSDTSGFIYGAQVEAWW